MKDITKLDYEDLNASNMLLENILSHLNIAVAVVSPTLEIVKTNSIFNHLFDINEALDNNQHLSGFSSGFWSDTTAASFLKDNYDDQQFNFDKEFAWEQGLEKVLNIKINSQLLDTNTQSGKQIILLTFTDVTVERENEKGRNQRIRFMMHELRNPLSNISLCIELLADSVKENDQEEANMFLSKASTSVQRMKELINNLNEVKHVSQ